MTETPFGRDRFLFADRIDESDLPAGSVVRKLLAYWISIGGRDRLPVRRDVDPLEMPRALLSHVFLMDVLRDGDQLDYHYRLVGTRNVAMTGRDATKRLASDVFGQTDRKFMMETFHATVREAVPTFWRAAVPHEALGQRLVYRGLFPLANDAKVVDMLIGAGDPTEA